MKKTLLLAGIMLMTRFLTANADVDPNFYVYLCFGQSNMEGNAAIEAQDKEYVDPRFKTLACVDFQDPRRNKGEWYTAYPPIVRQGTGLGMADYFGRTMVANLSNEITVGVVDVANGAVWEIEYVDDKGFTLKNKYTNKYLHDARSAQQVEPKYFTFCTLSETATGISTVRYTPVIDDDIIYDLNGRRVNESTLRPGIYIKNRKKIVIR